MAVARPPVSISPSPEALRAFQRGDVSGVLRAFGGNAEALARFAIEVRRTNVATLGSHEAFVRRTKDGQLRQIIRPVALSTKDGTLYQIGGGPRKKPLIESSIVRNEEGKPVQFKVVPRSWDGPRGKKAGDWKAWKADHPDERVAWEEVTEENVGPAILTFEGLTRCNEVVGASLVSPPTVVVDGERRTNPFVDRRPGEGGRLGDVRRVVLAQSVVAYAPATGNPVVVNYTLDYDPAKELSAMLARVAEKTSNDCYLTTEEEALAEKAKGKTRWQYHPLYGGVGYFFDLRLDDVRFVYKEFTQILAFATRKAQTVCLRNAMKRHPAFSRHHAIPDDRGEAIIPVVGWTSSGDALEQVQRITEAIGRGDRELDNIEAQVGEVVEVAEVYEPEADPEAAAQAQAVLEAPREEPGGSLLDQVARSADERRRAEEQALPAESPEHERNVLIQRIDEGMRLLSTEQVQRLGYDSPEGLDQDTLRGVIRQINALLDSEQQ